MTVEANLFSLVSTDSAFVTAASTRLYPIKAPQNVTLPYATYRRISGVRHHLMANDAGIVHARFQFDAWASTPDSARALIEIIRGAIQCHSGTSPSVIKYILIENDLDLDPEIEGDSEIFHSTLDAIVIYTE